MVYHLRLVLNKRYHTYGLRLAVHDACPFREKIWICKFLLTRRMKLVRHFACLFPFSEEHLHETGLSTSTWTLWMWHSMYLIGEI